MTSSQARQQIARLIEKHKNLDDSFRKSTTEAGVVHQFITPLLEALGWPVQDPKRFQYELHTEAGRPDMTLIPEQGGLIFVEAKRFGVIQELAQARTMLQGVVTPGQMALPGRDAWDDVVGAYLDRCPDPPTDLIEIIEHIVSQAQATASHRTTTPT